MHDIKFIKENSKFFDEQLQKRGLPPQANKILRVHELYIKLLKEIQILQEKKNLLSKKFSPKLSEIDLKIIKSEVTNIKKELEHLKENVENKNEELVGILLQIPNIIDDKTPDGSCDEDNKIIKEIPPSKEFNFDVKDHVEIAEKLNFLDYEKAIKLSGSRFSVLKSDLAKLYRALINFMIDINVENFNYEECVVPELIKEDCLIGTGQLPKFSDDIFKVDFNNLWLIPTAEVPLTNFHRDEIIDLQRLPLRYTAFTNCFRSEAGAAGKDTKGLIREHQFGKVELVSITEPSKSNVELERMVNCVESILNELELPYRLVELCSGDIGFSSSYTIDLEVWMPGQKKFREVSSCSNCKDFQSRRMKMRTKNFKTGEIFYPHTLNGSSVAVGRILISLLENFQQSDGSVMIPKKLRNYMKGIKIIGD